MWYCIYQWRQSSLPVVESQNTCKLNSKRCSVVLILQSFSNVQTFWLVWTTKTKRLNYLISLSNGIKNCYFKKIGLLRQCYSVIVALIYSAPQRLDAFFVHKKIISVFFSAPFANPWLRSNPIPMHVFGYRVATSVLVRCCFNKSNSKLQGFRIDFCVCHWLFFLWSM